MASQSGFDFSRFRLRAVELDGNLKSPRVRGFALAEVAGPEPAPEGEESPPISYADALKDLFRQHRFSKDPAAIALPSIDCTFRDLDLPFTGADQIDKVIKFEAESHLQLVEIDKVVVGWQPLVADGRGGSKLLAMAYQKEVLRRVLFDLSQVSVDPQIADLHLGALYTALCATGYLEPVPVVPSNSPPGTEPIADTVLVLECDYDVTHLLVAHGDELLGARAIRLGIAHRVVRRREDVKEGAGSDETLVVVDDLGGEDRDDGKGGKKPASDFYARLRREVQRTLFPLGPSGEKVSRVLLLGPKADDEAFRAHVESTLKLPVETAKPFDRLDHNLDEETASRANAEGTAALGAALRMMGAAGSRPDFRQEDLRYARRFDQVKVALSCLAIVALVAVALLCIVRVKEWQIEQINRREAIGAVLNEYEPHADNDDLRRKLNSHQIEPVPAAKQALTELETRFKDLSSDLGRSGTIPRLASGLDYLNAVMTAIDKALPKIERVEFTSIDLDVAREKPVLKLKGYLNHPAAVDAMVAALRACPAVKSPVQNPVTTGAKDGRLEISNMEVELVPDFDPRKSAKGGAP